MADPLNIAQLEALHKDNTGMQWLKSMASGGLRRSMSSEAASAYALAAQIHDLEDAIQETFTLEQLFFPLPKFWWFWVPLLYGFGFLWAFREDHFEDRLTVWGGSMVVFGIFAGWVLATKFYREQRALLEKRRQRPLLKEERRVVMADLMAARDACVAAERASKA